MMRYNGAPMEKCFPSIWDNFGGSCLESFDAGSWMGRSMNEPGISLDQHVANKMTFLTARANIVLGAYSRDIGQTETCFKAPFAGLKKT